MERLKEVLEFYKAFAQTFSKNLTLTYDLARRTVISRVSDRKMERVLNEVHQPFTPAQVLGTYLDFGALKFVNVLSKISNIVPIDQICRS